MSRVSKFRELLKNRELDGALIFNELNQHYLSGFSFTDGLLLITSSRAFLITDFRYFEMAEKEAYKDFEVVMPSDRKEFITTVLKQEECFKLGFEGGYVSVNLYEKLLSDYNFCKLENINGVVEGLRQIKDEEELRKMQKAQDITDKAFATLIKNIKTDMTEIEVAAELEYIMRREGASGLAFDTIAVSGDASALPHGVPRNVKLKKGFLTMDFGAKFDGYCSDMTRTIVIGKADDHIKKVYNTVLSAQLAALDYVRAGVECAAVDKVARDIIDGVDEFKGTFGHSLGHSVGLFIHESPRFSSKASGEMTRVGEIYTVEPGIYLYGKYGCRIEDMIAIESDGVYNFTNSTKELIEIL